MLHPSFASNGAKSTDWTAAPLHVGLLGGFRVTRAEVPLPDSAWQRRSAKTLTKLLATRASHTLHRDQVLEILWPDVDVESALNSFGKALHAARRAFEPELLPRESSAYLRLSDEMLTLDTEHILIDADHFQRLAEGALQLGSVSGYETALAAYAGELLPEDRYEDWSGERRHFLAELHTRVLLGLAEALENRGAYTQAADHLRVALQQDPTREEVHRRLMRLYAETGTRDQAMRQFQICQEALLRELNVVPERETEALYQDLLANRIQRRIPTLESGIKTVDSHPALTADQEERERALAAREAELEGQAARLDEHWAALVGQERKRLRKLLQASMSEVLNEGAAEQRAIHASQEPVAPQVPPPSIATRWRARLDLSAFPNIASGYELGGRSIVVTLVNGLTVRIAAKHDPESGAFVSEYESAEPGSLVWIPSREYRTCTSHKLTELLAAALREVDSGPQSREADVDSSALSVSGGDPTGDEPAQPEVSSEETESAAPGDGHRRLKIRDRLRLRSVTDS